MARELKTLGKELKDVKALLTTAVNRLDAVGEQANANGERRALVLRVVQSGASRLEASMRRDAGPGRRPSGLPIPELTPEEMVRQTKKWFKPLKVSVLSLCSLCDFHVAHSGLCCLAASLFCRRRYLKIL